MAPLIFLLKFCIHRKSRLLQLKDIRLQLNFPKMTPFCRSLMTLCVVVSNKLRILITENDMLCVA